VGAALILDGDKTSAKRVAGLLARLDFKSFLAATVREAEAILSEQTVEGVIIEPHLHNGVYAGLDFVDELLFDGWAPRRVLVLSASQSVELSRQCAEIGVAMHRKPVAFDHLQAVVGRWLNPSAALRQAEPEFSG